MSESVGNVHSAGGDLLVVIPVPSGWSICWYMPEEDGHGESLPEALSGAIEPEEEYDEDEEDDEDEDDEGQEERDAAEVKLVRDWCFAHQIKRAISAEDEEADHFVWPTREAAQTDADTMMGLIRAKRSAPWADAAIAAGWTPPAGWSKS